MKLVNKNTTNTKVLGEIVPCNGNEYGCIAVKTDQGVTWYYRSLAELNEEWGDYEEPKTFFTIYYDGTISEFKGGDDEQIRDMKEIGNYFDTREEAKKAVEKLKAAKRLKDKGFRFKKWDCEGNKMVIQFYFEKQCWATETEPDLDLLFSGGEE